MYQLEAVLNVKTSACAHRFLLWGKFIRNEFMLIVRKNNNKKQF